MHTDSDFLSRLLENPADDVTRLVYADWLHAPGKPTVLAIPQPNIAAKFKGKADAESTLVKQLTTGTGHPKQTAKEDDIKSLVKWVLSQ
jgi:uncharacterized protein (TIGR02996 family)